MSKLAGGIMMGVGILIAGLSGLCSIGFAIMGLGSGGMTLDAALPGLLVIGLFGGTPFAVGLGLFLAGRSIVRRADSDAAAPPIQSFGVAKIKADEPGPEED
jgi:hypothetical protein